MEYISIKEASLKWGLSLRRIQTLCSEGRIDGAVKYQRSWMIPANAEASKTSQSKRETLPAVRHSLPYRCPIFIMSRVYRRPGEGEQLIERLKKSCPNAAALLETAFCYYRFERERAFEIAEELYGETDCFDTRIGLAHSFSLKALYTGDAALWRKGRNIIVKTEYDSDQDLAQIEFNLAIMDSAIFTDESFPEWFMRGEWEHLPFDSFPPARYAYLKNLYINRRFDALAAAAGPLIAQCRAEGALVAEIYMRIIAAMGFHDAGDDTRAEAHLKAAWELASPDKIYAPFAEYRRNFGGILDKVIRTSEPNIMKKIASAADEIVDGWTTLHNTLYGTKLTNELTLREYEAARLVWRGMSNAEIARHMNISLNTVKLYMKAIYMKLDVKSREEILPYIWK